MALTLVLHRVCLLSHVRAARTPGRGGWPTEGIEEVAGDRAT